MTMAPIHPFGALFLLALLAGILLQEWLLSRQRHHVATHRDRVPPPFAGRISLADHQKAADYTLARTALGRWRILAEAVLLLFWTLGGGLEWLYRLWAASGLPAAPRDVAFVLSVIALGGLVMLPFSLWETFVIEERFGFNRTTWGRFLLDQLLELLLLVVLGGPLVWAVLWLMQHQGSYWWLWAWALWMGFTLLLSWLFPVVIAPLFNKFVPLRDDRLRERIQRLLERNGFHSKGVFVMDGSRRSGHGNAYFTGLGRNKRIVFYDTLLEGLTPEEVEAVLAHELGHYRYHHVHKFLLLSALSSLFALALLGWLAQQPWFYQGLGVSTQSPAMALILFLLAGPVFTQFLQPVVSGLMCRQEFQADEFAAAQVGAEYLVSALVKLYKDNASTLTPDPLYAAFYYSHPPATVRIARLSAKMKT